MKTDNPGGYIAVLDELHTEMKKRGYDVSMQVFMGDTGATSGTIMTSFGSASAAEVGRMLDPSDENTGKKQNYTTDGDFLTEETKIIKKAGWKSAIALC